MNKFEKIIERHWLVEYFLHARTQAVRFHFLALICRQSYYLWLDRLLAVLVVDHDCLNDSFSSLDAVHYWHLDIHEHESRNLVQAPAVSSQSISEEINCNLTILCLNNFRSKLRINGGLESHGIKHVVVNDKDSGFALAL